MVYNSINIFFHRIRSLEPTENPKNDSVTIMVWFCQQCDDGTICLSSKFSFLLIYYTVRLIF
jgi:hypothetical protein